MLRLFKRNRQDEIKHTQDAVKASRERWFGRIMGILRSSRLDESVWVELEEILISADVGVDYSLQIVDDLKETVRRDALDSPELVFESLKESLIADLESEDVESLWRDDIEHDGPYVMGLI